MTAPDPLHVPEGRGHPYDHGDEERVPLQIGRASCRERV